MSDIIVSNIMTEKTTIVNNSEFHTITHIDNDSVLRSLDRFPGNVTTMSVESFSELKSKETDTNISLYFEIELTGGSNCDFLQVRMSNELRAKYNDEEYISVMLPHKRIFDDIKLWSLYTYGNTGIRSMYPFDNTTETIPNEIDEFVKNPNNLYLTDDSFVDRIVSALNDAHDRNPELYPFEIVDKNELLSYDISHELRYRYTLNKTITENVKIQP